MASWIVKKLIERRVLKECLTCCNYLYEANDKPEEQITVLTRTLNKGRLKFASEKFSQLIVAAEHFFQALIKTREGASRYAKFNAPENALANAFIGE